jgi:glutamine amidotransferase-like uncharacterized protein
VKGRLKRAAGDPAYEQYRRVFRTGLPRVSVYTGEGASHSWIWFADLLERLGLFDVSFITDLEILDGILLGFDFLLVGGGDTYAMADSLGARGAALIEDFIRLGGMYHGSCAGAYLVLSGVDLEPFTPFDLIDADMVNVMPDPPPPACLEHKYLAPYGDEWVFHPVYGEVELSSGEAATGYTTFNGSGPVTAPLFGGPVLEVKDAGCILADYAGVTDRAAFPWPRERAEALLAGRQAVAIRRLGQGTVVASGPHLEHPLFPRSNILMAEALARHWERNRTAGVRTAGVSPPDRTAGVPPATSFLEIKRQVSNARIVGFGLEKLPVTWRIGVKVWEPEKIRMFLDYAWDRLPYLEREAARGHELPAVTLEEIASGYGDVTQLAKTLKLMVEAGQDSQAQAQSLLTRLKELTARFLSLYFALRLEERGGLDQSIVEDVAGWPAG